MMDTAAKEHMQQDRGTSLWVMMHTEAKEHKQQDNGDKFVGHRRLGEKGGGEAEKDREIVPFSEAFNRLFHGRDSIREEADRWPDSLTFTASQLLPIG